MHLTEQRQAINRFWKFVTTQAFSTIQFNQFLRKKYDTITLFNSFLLFLTNVDNVALKVFSINPTKDLFSLFFGFFKAKAHSHLGRDLFQFLFKIKETSS